VPVCQVEDRSFVAWGWRRPGLGSRLVSYHSRSKTRRGWKSCPGRVQFVSSANERASEAGKAGGATSPQSLDHGMARRHDTAVKAALRRKRVWCLLALPGRPVQRLFTTCSLLLQQTFAANDGCKSGRRTGVGSTRRRFCQYFPPFRFWHGAWGTGEPAGDRG
jgi:general stress protein YciG